MSSTWRADLGWAVVVALVVGFWVVLTVGDGDPAPVRTTTFGTAAAAGTAALVGARWRSSTVEGAAVSAALLFALPLGVSAASAGSAWTLAAVTMAVALGVAAADVTVAAAAGALAAVAVGVSVVTAGGPLAVREDDPVLALTVVAGVALLAAATTGAERARPLGAPALVVALAAAPEVPDTALLALAAAAVLAAIVPPSRPALALGLLAVTAIGATGYREAAILLAAGAMLALAVDHPAVAFLGLPGGAALARALVADDVGWLAGALAVAAAGVAVGLAARAGAAASSPPPGPALLPSVLPAAVLGGWLVFAPGSWAWAGASEIGPYDRGAGLALAVALIAAIVAAGRQVLLSGAMSKVGGDARTRPSAD